MSLNLLSRYPEALAHLTLSAATSTRNQIVGDVVAIPLTALHRMRRRHPIALAVEQQSSQQARLLRRLSRPSHGGIRHKLHLDAVPQGLINDRLVVARINFTPVADLTPIEPIRQDRIEMANAERQSASRCS